MLIGLTGGIASGKSTVAEMLVAHGAVIIDADLLARQAVAVGTPGLKQVVGRFGDEVLLADGNLDRAELGRIVFSDPVARADLEGIIHPEVRRRTRELAASAPPDAVIVAMIPLLVETGLQQDFDLVVVVDVDPGVQLQRVMERDRLDAQQAQARISAQVSREARLAAADLIIHNDAGLQELQAEVDRLWVRLGAGTPRLQR